MLNVVCVEVGDFLGRGREYVERLHDMVRRNLPAGFRGRFVVLTDCAERFAGLAGVEARHVPWNTPASWWAKMELFNPALFEDGDRVLFFDLDTCITGPLDRLAEYPGAFGLLRDVFRPEGFQSSVMAFIARTPLVRSIYETWLERRGADPAKQWPGGDQQFLEEFWKQHLPAIVKGSPWPPDFLQNLYPGALRSYKVECVWGIPRGTSVVFFHGQPRPHDLLTGWVPQVWKVGGGSSNELVLVGTVPQEEILRNVQINQALQLQQVGFISQPNGLHAVICAGGPSLGRYLATIATLQRTGALLFTVNGVERYFRDRGLQGNFHVMLDARPQMLAMHCKGGQKLYASIMNPAVIHQAASEPENRVTLWHPATEGIEELVPKSALIGGGQTAGVRSMALAYAMGFRKITCFGFDSCYEGDAHHAYEQALNDGEKVIDCIVRGKKFRAAGWMITQAEDWKACAIALAQHGVDIQTMPDGMIGELAAAMRDPYVEIDGTWWPGSDVEARPMMAPALEDLQSYIAMCPPERRRIAVQAGGNVGLFPKALAKAFGAVYTFEPDPDNFECLKRNVGQRQEGEGHVRAHPVALGAKRGACALEREVGNCGATHLVEVVDSPANERTVFRVVALDEFELPACDLLQLDVEGYELQALQGAERTILQHSPLIIVELKGHGDRYGYTDQLLIDWLEQRGYRKYGIAHRDVIFKREIL